VGGWRKLHSEGLHSLYASPNIITLTKQSGKTWEEHVARIETRETLTKF